MQRAIRLAILHAARLCGLFALARYLTRGKLRILAYHGGSLADEHGFRPVLFMTAGTFRQRMDWLVAQRYPVLGLEAALEALDLGRLPPAATVITIDDGWYGTYRWMAPALAQRRLPATLYVTTYYLQAGTQVFNVAAAYLLWKARDRDVRLDGLVPGFAEPVPAGATPARDRALAAIAQFADSLPGPAARQALLVRLGDAVGVPVGPLEADRRLAFMSAAEARELPGMGIDLQLHTHRHRFPRDLAAARREIDDNRSVLATVTGGELCHFCYPSGEYAPDQPAWLPALGLASAVTTEPGLNDRQTPRGELRRILDSEAMEPIEFEAEMSGFRELFRRKR
ncbi:MAG: polysaccharide deacetylase family protein [Gammaproteobacteria bacterium]|nr:polysaccharide deacetylase family protein [Gammaproteobacteria bacterium]